MKLLRKCIRSLLAERADDYEWAYLLSTPFAARNALAAYYCDYYDADRILEVGGYRNPLHQFYKGPASLITVVDPMLTDSMQVHETAGNRCKVDHRRGRLHEVDLDHHDTVVCIGLAINDTDLDGAQSYEALKDACKEAKTVILGVPTEWEQSVRQANELMSILPHEKTVDIAMDFTPSKVQDAVPVHNKRRLIVLRNEER